MGFADRPRVARPATGPLAAVVRPSEGQLLPHLPVGIRAACPSVLLASLVIPTSPATVTVTLDTVAALPPRVEERARLALAAPLASQR